MGIIEIKFNTKLTHIKDINSINETKLSLTLHPQDGRDQAEDFDESLLDFTWAPISITRENFLIQCEF